MGPLPRARLGAAGEVRSPALPLQQAPPVAVRCRVARLQLYGGAIPRQSCIRVPELVVRPRPVVLCPAVPWVHCDCAAVVLHRLLQPALHIATASHWYIRVLTTILGISGLGQGRQNGGPTKLN